MPRSVWRTHPGLGRAYVIMTSLTFGQGLALLLGGDERVVAAAFENIRRYGGPTVWGLLLIALAVGLALSAWRSRRAMRAALIVAGSLYTLLGLGFLDAALTVPGASYWGALQHAAFAAWLASQSEEYRSRAVHRTSDWP